MASRLLLLLLSVLERGVMGCSSDPQLERESERVLAITLEVRRAPRLKRGLVGVGWLLEASCPLGAAVRVCAWNIDGPTLRRQVKLSQVLSAYSGLCHNRLQYDRYAVFGGAPSRPAFSSENEPPRGTATVAHNVRPTLSQLPRCRANPSPFASHLAPLDVKEEVSLLFEMVDKFEDDGSGAWVTPEQHNTTTQQQHAGLAAAG